MHPFAEALPWGPIESLEALAIGACLVIWAWVVARLSLGRPVIAYQPRRAVPWQAVDLLMIVAFYMAMTGLLGLGRMLLGTDATPPLAGSGPGETTTEHVVGQLIAEGNIWILLLCGISAVIVAPVAEEFFFRVLLQGWLEAVQHRLRRKMPTLRRLLPHGAGPIVLTSFLFAIMHFRVGAPQIEPRLLIFLLAGDGVARVLAIAFAVGLLRWRVGATAADLGWMSEKILGDIKRGVVTFVAVAVPIYAMQFGLRFLLPECIAPDPIPLFFFALALGIIYYRTHRLMPLIVLHAALNGTSLALVWLGS